MMASSVKDRFWQKIIVKGKDDCWEWSAALNAYGYGWMWTGGRAKPKDPAIKAKLSATNKGDKNRFFGKKHSDEARQKMRDAHALRPPVICPHCEKTGQLNTMKRWHFDNCRSKA